jgi:hypothetical protein
MNPAHPAFGHYGRIILAGKTAAADISLVEVLSVGVAADERIVMKIRGTASRWGLSTLPPVDSIKRQKGIMPPADHGSR